MASTSEKGHAKNVANLKTLTLFCIGMGAEYQPTNPNLSIAAQTAKHNISKTKNYAVAIEKDPFDRVEGERMILFKPLKKLSTRVLAAVTISGATQTVIDDATTINRKIQGKRADNTPPPPATPTGGATTTQISVSQQSYDMQVEHLFALKQLITNEPNYNPNETDLQTTTIDTLHTTLDTINDAVKTDYIPYQNAMTARDLELYHPETGIVQLAKKIKTYIKSVYSASSPQYQQANAIQFRTIKS
jgi:hypothetical protein